MAEGFSKVLKNISSLEVTETLDSTVGVDQSKVVTVDRDTNRPDKAWYRISKGLKVKTKHPIDGHTPVSEDKVRFVCLSDTHSRIEGLENFIIPSGDVLLHAGDFTGVGRTSEVDIFNKFIGRLPHRYKIVIAGNHDLCLDDNYTCITDRLLKSSNRLEGLMMKKYKVRHPRELLSDCIYLLDEMVEVAGIKIYGAPWQPVFGTWGFQIDRGRKLLEKWNQIPDDVDVLMTHGPPLGMGDRLNSGRHVGCVELLNTVVHRVKPKFHVFGHIHEGYGMCTDGTTTYINASNVTLKYKPTNPPIVFDINLPAGKSKNDLIIVPSESSC